MEKAHVRLFVSFVHEYIEEPFAGWILRYHFVHELHMR